MLITRSQVEATADKVDGTFVIVDGQLTPYYPAPEFGTHRGYAVATHPLFEDGADVGSVSEGSLIGTWFDPETGTLHVDHVAHVKGSEAEALLIASAFDQKAIYSFQTGEVIDVPQLVS